MTANINRKYKDRLFVFLFGNEKHKEWTLQLYNAINGSEHKDPEDITFNTIEDALYLKMRNDVSFLIDDEVDVYEHQSTWNPNMALRQLLYVTKLYEGVIEDSPTSIYSRKIIMLPNPRFVVFITVQKTLMMR